MGSLAALRQSTGMPLRRFCKNEYKVPVTIAHQQSH